MPQYRISVGQALGGWPLDRDWRFRVGDDPAWAEPRFDDSGWRQVALPHRWYPDNPASPADAYGWYRLHIQFENGRAGREQLARLGLRLGEVFSAYEVYAGGLLIGGVGKLPPAAEPVFDYERRRVLPVPLSAIANDGSLVLALRVWGGSEAVMARWGAGLYRGEVALGTFEKLLTDALVEPVPGLLVTVICLGFGIYFLYLYYYNRQLDGFLWFGLCALLVGTYCLMLNAWHYQLGFSVWFYKKLEYGALYLLPPLLLQMFCALLEQPLGRGLRLYQLSFLLFAGWWLLTPGLDFHIRTLTLWQFWTLPLLLYLAGLALHKAWQGQREARTVLVGALLFVAACMHDIFSELFRLSRLRLLPWGFLGLMLAMAVSLGKRFTVMLNRLEEEVAERTAELSDANRQLSATARVDPLTGLLNRRGFADEAEAEVRRSLRSGRGFSIALCDVDLFKAVNDRYGHACGDFVLTEVAALLRDHVRDVDCVARWGGEEFILLLPDTDGEGAAVLAEKLREVIAEASFDYEGAQLQVTMTFGVSAFRRGENIERCIARADAALYRGKGTGRNKVMIGRYQGLTLVT